MRQPIRPAATIRRVNVTQPQVAIEGSGSMDAVLISFEVVEAVNAPVWCRLVLADAGPAGTGQSSLLDQIDFGRTVTITVPDQAGSALTLFQGRVYELCPRQDEGMPPQLEVTGFDRLQELAMARRSRGFQSLRAADAMRITAQEHGFRPDIVLDGPVHDTLVQANQTDLAFLQGLARETDAEFWVEGTIFHVSTRPQRPGHEIALAPGSGLKAYRVTADLAGQRQGFAVGGWNVATKAPISETAGAEAVADETGPLTSAVQSLQGMNVPVLGKAERAVHTVPGVPEEAAGSARARFAAMARDFVTLRGTADGNGRLRVGGRILLSGVGARIQGTYRVVEARHVRNAEHGYRTEFTANRTGIGS